MQVQRLWRVGGVPSLSTATTVRVHAAAGWAMSAAAKNNRLPADPPEFSRVQAMVVKREALGDKILMNWLWKILLP